jgi:hypothetical protein
MNSAVENIQAPQGPKGSLLGGNLMAYRKDPLGFLTDLQKNYGGEQRYGSDPKKCTSFMIRRC